MTESDVGALIDELDVSDMLGWTRRFVDDLERAWALDLELAPAATCRGVLCLGMGGSAAGGAFLSALANDGGSRPFVSWRHYGLPAWWTPDWLVLATSYSGHTEETLDGVGEALRRGGRVIGLASGGRLAELLGDEGGTHVAVPGGQPPRSAFGHLFGTQLAVCWATGLLPRPERAVLEGVLARLRQASAASDPLGGSGRTTRVAASLQGRGVGILATHRLAPAGYRFMTQFNENAGHFARAVEVPEMNHNEIVAWGEDHARTGQALLALTATGAHPRVAARLDWMLAKLGCEVTWELACPGDTLLEQLLVAAHVTDWITLVRALLNHKDPTSIGPIVALKDHLRGI